jgi:hypothetical protein
VIFDMFSRPTRLGHRSQIMEGGTVTRTQYLLRCGAWKWGSPRALGLRFSMQFLCVVDDDFFFFSISTVYVIIQRLFQCNIYLLHDPTC